MKKTMIKKWLLTVLFVFSALLLAACGKKEETKPEEGEKPETEEVYREELEEVDMSVPDNSAFQWTGDYLDATGGQALLHIEPNQRRTRGYEILIYIPGGEASFSTWSATAVYDESVGGLHYDNCVRTNMDTSETGESEVAYEKGSGVIIPSGDESDTLLWIDNQDKRGVDLRFERMEE